MQGNGGTVGALRLCSNLAFPLLISRAACVPKSHVLRHENVARTFYCEYLEKRNHAGERGFVVRVVYY